MSYVSKQHQSMSATPHKLRIFWTQGIIDEKTNRLLTPLTYTCLFKAQLHFKNTKNDKELKECCQILGVSEAYDQAEIRNAFLQLAKKYHPDSQSPLANADTFAKVDRAYRKLREHIATHSEADDVYQVLEKDFGIKHTVPQHRHYLSYEGIGYGTPKQRQQQYQRYKISRASNRVHEYRTEKMLSEQEKTLISRDAALTRQYKTTQAVERLVEDLIQESMAKGEFDNLAGSGKPLPQTVENPYVDSMTEKLNQILINNGFQPEWIMLGKEIKEEKEKILKKLREERSKLGKLSSFSSSDEEKWRQVVDCVAGAAKKLNAKIEKYNMVVPTLSKQKLLFRLQKEAQAILEHGDYNTGQNTNSPPSDVSKKQPKIGSNENESFFDFILKAFQL